MKHWRKVCIVTLLTTSTALIPLAGVGGSVDGAQYEYLMDISFNRAPGAPTLNNFPVLVVLNSDITNWGVTNGFGMYRSTNMTTWQLIVTGDLERAASGTNTWEDVSPPTGAFYRPMIPAVE